MKHHNLPIHIIDGIPHVTCSDLKKNLPLNCTLIDVRTPEEYTGELGNISNSQLVTLGQELVDFLQDADRKQDIIFICRSGARSAQATAYAMKEGFESVANLKGGMLEWAKT